MMWVFFAAVLVFAFLLDRSLRQERYDRAVFYFIGAAFCLMGTVFV